MLVHIRQLRRLTGGTNQEGRNLLPNVSLRHSRCPSAGPIVEQGTHFCDLSRYFGGEVDIATVTAHSLEWDENAGKLSNMSIDESQIAPENRIPRVTAATWSEFSPVKNSKTELKLIILGLGSMTVVPLAALHMSLLCRAKTTAAS